MNNRKGLQLYDNIQKSWVGPVKSFIKGNTVILIAEVMHSKRKNDIRMNPWVALSLDGHVDHLN